MFWLFLIMTIGRADASPSPSPSPPPEITHVYTSDRSDQTLPNVARTTYVITRSDIVRRGYRSVGEALEQLPAFELAPYGGTGASAQYGIRGSNSAEVLVLIDGLPAPGSFSNSVELQTMPTTGVQRIEVVEGGGSTLYGTGAIGGIINVITDRAAAFGATLRAGSFGDSSFELRAPNVQVSRIVARNDYPLPNGARQADSDFASSALHANMGRDFGSWQFTARALMQSDRVGAPGPDAFSSLSSRETDFNEALNLSFVHRGLRSESSIETGATDQRITFACDAVNDPDCFQTAESLNRDTRLEVAMRNAVGSEREQLLYGVDLARGNVRADAGGFFTASAMAQTAAYVQQKFYGSWGTAYAGVRAERDGGLGGELSPSAGFALRIRDGVAIKGNIATAFRAPNTSELYFPGFGNPSLRPERAKVADLTFDDANIFGGIALGWFGNRTNDLIVTELIDPVNFVFAPENVGHALIEGLTLDVRTRPLHGVRAAFNLTDLYRAEDLDTQNRLPDDPVLTGNLRLEYTGVGFVQGFGASIHAVGKRGRVDPELPLFDQPAAFTRTDAYLALRAAQKIVVTLRAYNLGNERYAGVSGFPLPGRSFVIELSTR